MREFFNSFDFPLREYFFGTSPAPPPPNKFSKGAIHSTKIPTGPTGKSGPPQKVDPFFRNFFGWTKPIH